MPAPNRHYRLVLWWLTYQVPLTVHTIPESLMRTACEHSRMPWETFQQYREEWPNEFAKVMDKRARRRRFLQENGYVPDGWTPPKDKRTANYPHAALAIRNTAPELRPLLLGGR